MLKFVVRHCLLFCMCALISMSSTPAPATDYRLPDAGEIQGYSQPALQFYLAGVAALDRVDYRNAYNFLAKAAQLQPGALRLQQLTAGLAMDFGRRVKAEDAKNFYQTAVSSYESVLRLPSLDPDVRRDLINRLKIAKDEMNYLAQRDVIREASGQKYVIDQNKKYGGTPTPSTNSSSSPADVALTPAVADVGATPNAQGRYPGQVILTPAVPVGPGGQPINGDPGFVDPELGDPALTGQPI